MTSALFASEPSLAREITQRLKAGIGLRDIERLGVTMDELRAWVATPGTPSRSLVASAILAFLRPVLPMTGDRMTEPDARFWHRRLKLAESDITRAARSIGRIELDGHPGLKWAGTCCLIADRVTVTTRLTAAQFSHSDAGRVTLGLRGGATGFGAYVRFHGASRYQIKEVRMTDAAALGSELAFLVLQAEDLTCEPIRLYEAPPGEASLIAGIGFVATDSRAGTPLTELAYVGSFNQKCVAPGRLLAFTPGKWLSHDCATVGNSAGALILDLNSGKAVGLHVHGASEGPGTGVTSTDILETMKALDLPLPARDERRVSVDEGFFEDRGTTAEDYRDRPGYRSAFLGIEIPPPTLRAPLDEDVLTVEGANGGSTTLLAYTHFSVCMSKSRRLCFFTACNVHGGALQDLGRTGIQWLFDPRVDRDFQAGNDLYRQNDLDRGHMVRRLDPVWGDEAEAANEDTFHFTNSCPQHKDLNQRTWNNLEDYVLQNAGKYQLKLNVFTGPVFRDDDPGYRGFQLPLEFWKVVVMIKDDDTPSATAYVLSQADLVTGLEFAFGEFRTYQVPLADVQKWTHLDFGELLKYDPKKDHDMLEADIRFVPIEGPRDLLL